MARTMVDVKCEHCETAFQRRKGQVPEHVFCSQACYLQSGYRSRTIAAANIARSPNAKTTEPCGGCGAMTTRYISSRGKLVFCSTACRDEHKRSAPKRRSNKADYVLLFVGVEYPGATKAGYILEHRKVMQERIGRQLERHENVHHINGDKRDNSIENLELWSTSQPQGQRVKDKIRWAREFLALYEKSDQ